MKQAAAISILLLIAPRPARAQSAFTDSIKKAETMYAASNYEAAKQIFTSILASKIQVSVDDKVTAYKYLGGYWAVQGKADSASSYFRAAIDYDPFATLDQSFAADEQAAFAQAQHSIFKIGIQPVDWFEIDPLSSDAKKKSYNFKVVSTRSANLQITIVGLTDPAKQGTETFSTISRLEGPPRDVPWNGTVGAQLADSGLWEFRVVATDQVASGTPLTETQRFRVERVFAPLEDTLPSFVDVTKGGTDTLTSRLGASVPILDGLKGTVVALFAGGLPYLALNPDSRLSMSGWKQHWAAGIMLGAGSGGIAALWGVNHRDDQAAKAENARRKQVRDAFNTAVRTKNQARLDRTVLILRPVGG